MSLLTATELRRVERKHTNGVSSPVVVELFQKKGERFSEATLRKYVQLGLLPKSRRVGIRGRHRGSSGLYPVAIVRQINEIKQALDAGATLDEIRVGKVGLAGEVNALRRAGDEVLLRFGEALKRQAEGPKRTTLRRALDKQRRALYRDIQALSRLAARLGPPRLE